MLHYLHKEMMATLAIRALEGMWIIPSYSKASLSWCCVLCGNFETCFPKEEKWLSNTSNLRNHSAGSCEAGLMFILTRVLLVCALYALFLEALIIRIGLVFTSRIFCEVAIGDNLLSDKCFQRKNYCLNRGVYICQKAQASANLIKEPSSNL